MQEKGDGMGRIYSDITWTIGNTPLVRLNHITKGLHADVIVKVESFNPMGSVKDRIGLSMVEKAEREGKIKGVPPLLKPQAATLELHLQVYALPAAISSYWSCLKR